MFNKFGDNRKMEAADDGGNINLSGHTSAGDAGGGVGGDAGSASGVGGTETPEQIAAREAAEAAAVEAKTKELNPIGDDTDKFTLSVLNEKYDSELGNVRINGNGDVVNLDGEVLVAKADLSKLTDELKTDLNTKADDYIKTLEVVEIEGVEYKIGEDGSIKNEKGEVILTTDQLRDKVMESDDYMSSGETDDVSVYEAANTITGFKLTDEEGNPVNFEVSTEGLAQRDLHIARQEGTRIANEQVQGFFAQNPDLLDAYYYKQARGSLEGIGSRTNHEGITIDKDNEQQQLDTIVEAEMLRGLDKAAATKRANMFKDNDMAYEESKASLTFMQGKEKADREADRATAEQQAREQAEQQEQYWTNVSNTINSGKLLDYTIPENIRVKSDNGVVNLYTREDFLNYVSKPVKDGYTQAQIDAANEPLDVKLFSDLIRFTNHDMSYIVDQKVKANQVSNFKQRFSRQGIPNKKISITPVRKDKSNNDDIVFNK